MILITKNVKSKAAKERLKLFASIYLAALKLGVEGKFVLRMLMWEESKVNEKKTYYICDDCEPRARGVEKFTWCSMICIRPLFFLLLFLIANYAPDSQGIGK